MRLSHYLSLFIKGIAMGAANVIPGVSGGTIALITGIFEKLIHSIKSCNLEAAKLLFAGKWKAFANHINLDFLLAVMTGVAISILSLAKLFDYLFINFPVYIWSYFFGLILASVYFVGKTIDVWKFRVYIGWMIGAAIAISISVLSPASENDSFIYLLICGVVAACSMILPGLSGSFVLILMGNYQLVMIDSVNELRFEVLIPIVIGAGVGLIAFSHLLSYIFKNFRDMTLAILSGFILGSLGLLWPWKVPVFKLNDAGGFLLKKSGAKIVEGYQWLLPESLSTEVIFAFALIIGGIITIWIMEKVAKSSETK